MADKNEHSHADELLDILQNFRDGDSKKEDKPAEAENPAPTYDDDIDEALAILNAGRSDSNEGNGADGTENSVTDGETADIPVSIFGHLKDESEIEEAPVADTTGSHLHFTDEAAFGDITIEEGVIEDDIDEDDDDEDDDEEEDAEPEEKVAPIVKVGRIFQKMSALPKALIYMVLIVLVSAYLSYYIVTIGNDIFALVSTSREVEITITEGMTDEDVAEMLESEGIIEYGWVYKLYMKYRGDGDSQTEYVPGTYTLRTDHNYSQIIYIITSKTAEREIIRITIPEGFTVDQIIDLLVQNGIGTKEGYVDAINNYPYKWEFVKMLDEKGYSPRQKISFRGLSLPRHLRFLQHRI